MKFLTVVFAAMGFAPSLLAQDYSADKPALVPQIIIPLTPEQKLALQAIDARLAGVEALVAKVDDAAYRENCAGAVRDLKRRRAALEKNFEPSLYEALMHSVISRYQVVALWLTPPRLPAPAEKPPTGKK